MKNSIELRKLKLILLFPIAVLLVNISSLSPYLVENIYSRCIYKLISQGISLLVGWIPVSVGEFVIIAFIPFGIVVTIMAIVKTIRNSSGRGRRMLNYILNVLVLISVLYFAFVVTWDINYQRLPFSQIAGLDVRPATVGELTAVCESLIEHTNEFRSRVKEDSNGVMELSMSLPDTLKSAPEGYAEESRIYPELGGRYSSPKGVLFSRVMSMLGIQGIHNPLTQEANVNTEISACMIPSTACHEMAHQRGFAREDEANYISYLVCGKNPGDDFKYSGELLALIYSMNALYDSDRTEFNQLYGKYSPGVVRDLSADREYWQSFKGPVEKINSAVNDAYLKANKQVDGVKSYGRMVDLLIAQYRKEGPQGM